MNIMMVSVTERTREVGIRKALGATFYDIMLQFLTGAIVIGVAGGILGIAVAGVISVFGSLTTVVSIMSVLLSFGFSIAVGLFFGIWPARKAALLDPIEALRFE